MPTCSHIGSSPFELDGPVAMLLFVGVTELVVGVDDAALNITLNSKLANTLASDQRIILFF